jgi:broad specificity phosphatase PhoE
MRLYLVRHGQSTGNIKHLYFQPPTEPLSDTGTQQAHLVGKRLKDLTIDEIVTSDFTRAEQTGEIINGYLDGVPRSSTPLLRERRGNSLLKDKSWGDPEVDAHMAAHRNATSPDFKEHDEETLTEIMDRAQAFLDFVSKKDVSHLVVVSHGIFIHAIVMLVALGRNHVTPALRDHFFSHTWISNTGISVIDQWEHDPEGWYLLTWNDHAHLS